MGFTISALCIRIISESRLPFLACFGGSAGMVDEQFGKVLTTLDDLALAATTVVMFVGDHGKGLPLLG